MSEKVVTMNQDNEVEDISTLDLVIKFNKPYFFEGTQYEGVDLSGLEDMTARDMIAAQKLLPGAGNGNVMPEVTLEFACIMASRCTEHPVEFFRNLPAKEAVKLKNRVMNFFYGQE